MCMLVQNVCVGCEVVMKSRVEMCSESGGTMLCINKVGLVNELDKAVDAGDSRVDVRKFMAVFKTRNRFLGHVCKINTDPMRL